MLKSGLGRSGSLSEDERSFLQARVAAFGLAAGSGFLGFFLFRVALILTVMRRYEQLLEPSMGYHLGASLCLLAVWAICRSGTQSARLIRTVEAAGLLSAACLMAIMGRYVPPIWRPDYILLLALTFALTARAIWVPSSARRSFVIALAVGAELLATLYWVFASSDMSTWRAIDSGLADRNAHQLAVFMVINAAAWWCLTIFVTTAASRVIYGLRRQARDAKQLGQYRLEEKLGEGGMGVVYRASHALLRRPTAIKLLHSDQTSPETLERFAREVQLTASLSHPNTIRIYDYGKTPEGTFYYAMEYIDGATLDAIVASTGPQPPARVAHVIAQVAAALVEAHGVELIHRDIKPANIMLHLPHRVAGLHEMVRVLDFGLVKELEADETVNLTHAGAITGTPQYMAPEMIQAPERIGPRSDLYALGAVAYYMLTGQHVFEGRTVVEVCSQHLHQQPIPPSERVGQPMPAELERIVLDCLEKDPDQRPDSALTLQERLQSCASKVGEWTADAAQRWWQEHEASVSRPKAAPSGSGVLTVDLHRAATVPIAPEA